ncbi:MAG: hypothetical protein H6721_00300 [Sandaracinus sp.]|nr:hypothetical protein [Sandaracinus sp.]MCB9625460.1 hypothetical protein [Sandaracinus sp.]MCB9630583.1 hypothetical protein [Sandaracinus sp.]
MTDSLIPYEDYVHDALRSVVARVLTDAAISGLPGEHHFYVTFQTNAAGVDIAPDLRARYPETMTVVLQHQYEALTADDKGFGVTLRFGGVPYRLSVPFTAITAFVDPSVKFGLQLPVGDVEPEPEPEPKPEPKVETSKSDNVVTVDFSRKK